MAGRKRRGNRDVGEPTVSDRPAPEGTWIAPWAGGPVPEPEGPMPWESLPQEPDRPLDDVGPAVLDYLFSNFQIEHEWAVREERSFTWWPWAMAVRVEASEPRLGFGDAMVRVRAVADVLRGVTAPDDLVLATLAMVNMHTSMASYVWDPAEATISAVVTAYFHEGNTGLLPVFSTAILLATTEGHARARSLAEVLGGEPATSARPGAPLRTLADELMNFSANVVVPRGQGPSEFRGRFGEAVASPNIAWCMTSVDDEAFTGELPFCGTMPGIVAATLGAHDRANDTALVQCWTSPHPSYGSGLLMVMRLPLDFETSEEVRRLANDLNLAEATEPTGFPLLGAWCEDPAIKTPTLSFVSFVPSILARPTLVGTLCFYFSLRCWWVRARLT